MRNSPVLALATAFMLFWTVGAKAQDALTANERVPGVPAGAQAGDYSSEPCIHTGRGIEYAANCGVLIVSENRSDPNSNLIALPVTHIPSTGANPAEPIFKLGGGPGISNMNYSRANWYLENHDFVIVGFRGVDGSVRLDCPEVSSHMRSGYRDLLGDEALGNMSTAFSDCAARIQATGVDLTGYDMIGMIDDLEDARHALGYDQINLISGSFGTRLAMIYSWRHPEALHRSAQVSVNPPGHFAYDPATVDDQMQHYARLCVLAPACNSRTDDLAATIRDVSHNMPTSWYGLPIDAGMIRVATFESLADTSQAGKVFDVWLAAAEGDYSGMVMLSLAGPFMFADAAVWGDNAAKGMSTGEYDRTFNYSNDMDDPDTIIGAPRAAMAEGWFGWPDHIIDEEYQRVHPSDVETLLVNGNLDLFTPARFVVDEYLPSLSNGQMVLLSEFGHTGDVYYLQPEATRQLLTTFFLTGTGDDSLYVPNVVTFEAGLGFPLMAKLLLAGLVIAMIIVFLLLRGFFRLFRRTA